MRLAEDRAHAPRGRGDRLETRELNVGISFGTLPTLHEGLGEFSVQLGRRIVARAEELHREHGIRLQLYLPKARHGLLGDRVEYLEPQGLHRLVHVEGRRFDLWHTLNQHVAYRPPVAARARLLTVHDLNFLYVKRGASLLRHRWVARRRIGRADRVVAITAHVAEDVRRHAAFRGPVDVIHNGARSLVGDPQEAIAGLVPRTFLFHLSRMTPSKNVGALVELAAAWPERPFVLAGPSSPVVDGIAAEVRARGLANVTVLRDVSEAQKAWLYASCAGFLFPSLTEGFGLPPIEAMHFGAPTFLSDRTCLPEVGGDAAYYFRRFDPAHMREVVEAGLADARGEGRVAAIRRHAAGFSWDACADRYVALYLELLGLRRR
jgi:glycosyltransferase involved in cell wall biosynthesis